MNDFLGECNTQGLAPEEFETTFCARCKQPDCRRAAWGHSLMDQRVRRQVKRLLHPDQADPNLSKYAHLVDFDNMFEYATRLEIANRRGDWEVPEIPIEDGVVRVSSPDHVDAAVKAMARSQGKEEPELPAPEEEAPTPTPPPPKKKTVSPTKVTLRRPQQGVMVGGGPAPPEEVKPEPKPELDPWAPPDTPPAKKVPVGATIRMGGK